MSYWLADLEFLAHLGGLLGLGASVTLGLAFTRVVISEVQAENRTAELWKNVQFEFENLGQLRVINSPQFQVKSLYCQYSLHIIEFYRVLIEYLTVILADYVPGGF